MKGIVFNLLAAVTMQQYGEDAWDDILAAAGVVGAYTSLGSYSDTEMLALVEAAGIKFNQSPDDVLRWFGIHALPLMARQYGSFFQGHNSTRAFLLTLNSVIHPEVLKLYPGAQPPEFNYETSGADRLLMEYRSQRQLCTFAEGLILGAAHYFQEKVVIHRPQCSKRGDPHCLFQLSFSSLGEGQ